MARKTRAMENVVVTFWAGKHVLLTGHTGFKGAWLALWLRQLGAQVTGIALAPDQDHALFNQLALEDDITHHIADIRDAALMKELFAKAQPDIVMHLAAQSLVLPSYAEPIETFNTNVMGTINVLNAARQSKKPCAIVAVTTDKVYRNNEWEHGYRETDHLGGYDPYSASKAAAEIAISCWRSSFMGADSLLKLASVRAGNVIGGGDWAKKRIVPDLIRALSKGEALAIRSPHAVRPWQHVLEPLGGYLWLAQNLYTSNDSRYQDAFNFGPMPDAERSVQDLTETAIKYWPGEWIDASDKTAPHEAGRLALTIDRARARLNWTPRWDFERTIKETIDWYKDCQNAGPDVIRARTLTQIEDYGPPVS